MKLSTRVAAITVLLALTLAGCSSNTEQPETEAERTSSPTAAEECGPNEYLNDAFKICVPSANESESGIGQIEQTSSAFFSSANESGALDIPATTEYLTAVIGHLDTIWTNWFIGEGYSEPFVGYALIQPEEAFVSNCPINGINTFPYDYPNAIYCDLDKNQWDAGIIILPTGTMANMWTGNIFTRQVEDIRFTGDFAAATIVAHEFGHHIQFQLATDLGKTGPTQPQSELIADCFAGVWAYSVAVDGYLEEGDVDEAMNALAVIGDNPGSGVSHGTASERSNAFAIGLYGTVADPRGGVPQNCIAAYWPGFNA